MSEDVWLTETYFDWLRSDAFSARVNRREYEGLLRLLHDIPFYWTIWSDENRAGDAMAFRQYEFLKFQSDLETLDQVWLGQWATAAPTVLEVMLGMCRRWGFYFEHSIAYYFGHMFRNMEFDRYPGRTLSTGSQEAIRTRVDDWLSRQFQPDGKGSPFPVNDQRALDIVDMRKVEIWAQMNAYSFEHFQ